MKQWSVYRGTYPYGQGGNGVGGMFRSLFRTASPFSKENSEQSGETNAQYQIGNGNANCASSKKSSQFEVVLARLKRGPACRKEILRGIRSPMGNHLRPSSRYSFTNILATSTHKRSRHPNKQVLQ